MQSMFKKMDTLYKDLSEYYVFDRQKYTLEEFFTDLKTFKDSFLVSRGFNSIFALFKSIFCRSKPRKTTRRNESWKRRTARRNWREKRPKKKNRNEKQERKP